MPEKLPPENTLSDPKDSKIETMRMYILVVLVTGLLFLMASCEIINPEEAIPAYLFIPEFT